MLKIITVAANRLSGTFPPCFYNMSSLILISTAENRFSGSLQSNMFQTLPNIQSFEIRGNQIFGSIPTSIENASILTLFDIWWKPFCWTGSKSRVGKLQDLYFKLQILSLTANNFGGCLPKFVGNLSSELSYLYLGGNEISGEVPAELGNLVTLTLEPL
ncbi:leucine-rich receptor-like kinase family protein [Medicago truncatula]|uniref:Leucine-rich receptor-like kinase family protein n=1 Tax=Medicago truncatula TaxID=3880 RepID=G7KPA5_MEDTR|nr:leucine-rich receptor-like kinase family protein [Medicago truncatula]